MRRRLCIVIHAKAGTQNLPPAFAGMTNYSRHRALVVGQVAAA